MADGKHVWDPECGQLVIRQPHTPFTRAGLSFTSWIECADGVIDCQPNTVPEPWHTLERCTKTASLDLITTL